MEIGRMWVESKFSFLRIQVTILKNVITVMEIDL